MNIARDVFSEELGIVIDEEKPGAARGHIDISPRHLNQHGTVHGGVVFSLADAVFARASNSRGVPAVALDTSMTFIRASRVGDVLYACCEEAGLRRKVAVYTVRVYTGDDDVVALFRGTVYRLAPGFPDEH